MKKIFALFAVFCLCFSGCVSTDPQIDPELVVMEITEYFEGSVGFEIKNNSKDRISFGENYSLEFYNGKEWEEVGETSETFFIAIAHILESENIYSSSANLEMRYGILSDGNYRIVKEIRFLNEDGEDYGGQEIFAEFEVSQKER